EDPVGQDHAPTPAGHRGGQGARGHDHPGGPERGGRDQGEVRRGRVGAAATLLGLGVLLPRTLALIPDITPSMPRRYVWNHRVTCRFPLAPFVLSHPGNALSTGIFVEAAYHQA